MTPASPPRTYRLLAAALGGLVLAGGLAGLGGCGFTESGPRPLQPESFASPRPVAAAPAPAGTAGAPGDPGAARPGAPAASTTPPSGAAGTPAPPKPAAPVYMTYGGKVAEVNGAPIQASTVIAMLDPSFRAWAKDLAPEAFRARAEQEIRGTVFELITRELEFAAADRGLDADEHKKADLYTVEWRRQQITKSGGSIELAKRQAMKEFGTDFETLVEEHRKEELIRIHQQKAILPRIVVTAADLREYYERNRDKKFTVTEKVKFRLLKVDVAQAGGKEQAIKAITDMQRRAKEGHDFADMVLHENKDSSFARADPHETAPASFAYAAVRPVLATLPQGQVSDVIEDKERGAFYLVRIEERQTGHVRPFEEQKVQSEIRFTLRAERYSALREGLRRRLLEGAIVRPTEPVLRGTMPPRDDLERQMLQTPIEMAMQKYAQYRAASEAGKSAPAQPGAAKAEAR